MHASSIQANALEIPPSFNDIFGQESQLKKSVLYIFAKKDSIMYSTPDLVTARTNFCENADVYGKPFAVIVNMIDAHEK